MPILNLFPAFAATQALSLPILLEYGGQTAALIIAIALAIAIILGAVANVIQSTRK